MFKKLGAVFLASTILLSTPATFASASVQNNLILTAKNQIGTPYVWGGQTTKGFDCSGFLNYVFEKQGIDLPRTVAEIHKLGTSVKKTDLKTGDIVFFETYKKGASHAGIYIEGGKFIHAGTSTGVTITNLDDPYYWGSKYIGAKRVLQDVPDLQEWEFLDVSKDHWAYAEISAFTQKGIISGYSDGTFKPNNVITRAQAASVIANVLDLPKSGNGEPFVDVDSNHGSYAAIVAVYEAGIFTGDANGKFNPNGTLTRAHLAAILDRIYILENKSSKSFTDTQNHWAKESIEKVTANGLFSGYENGQFGPNDPTKRAQFVSVLSKAMKKPIKKR